MKQEADKKDINCWKRDAGKKFAFFNSGNMITRSH